ncbi:MAG: spore coat protein CotJB [Limnochordales bacterium]|nr:spore coat protein CotJB [Limnochordales bacterium]
MAERRSRGLSSGFGWGRRYDDDKDPALTRTPATPADQTGAPQSRSPRSAAGDVPPAEQTAPAAPEGSVSVEPARTITPDPRLAETAETGIGIGEEEISRWEGRRTATPDDQTRGWGGRSEGEPEWRLPQTPEVPDHSPRDPEDRRFPDAEERRMLCRIQEAEFRAIDWMLAADLRPHDRETLNNYNEAARRVHELMHQYEERFGAFMWMQPGWPARRHTGPFAVADQEYFEEETV